MRSEPGITLLVIASIGSISSGADAGETIEVPQDYATIAEALVAAQIGDTVVVDDGTYIESLFIDPGKSVVARNHYGVRLNPPSSGATSVFFVDADSEEVSGASLLKGCIVTNGGYEFGPPPIWSENPNAVVEECRIAAGGPGLWLDPVVYMPSGGTVRNCHVTSIRWTNFFVSTEPGAYMLVENCLIGDPFAPGPLNSFGAGSVTVFRNNTFIGAEATLERDGPDITMLFENNIFWSHTLCSGSGEDPIPEGMEFRYNCLDYFNPFEFPACASAGGPGNFAEDPLFCDDPDQEWWLTPESPCIGAGANGEDLGAPLGICGVTGVGHPGTSIVSDGVRVWPNPARDLVHVSFRSEPDAYLDLEGTLLARVLDAAGRLVAVAHGRLAGAEVQFEWNTRLQNGELAPAGVYHLQPVSNPGSTTQVARISIIR